MNERIRKLAIESGLRFRVSAEPIKIENGYALHDTTNIYDDFDLEKFTHLLLTDVLIECDDYCDAYHYPTRHLCEKFGIDYDKLRDWE